MASNSEIIAQLQVLEQILELIPHSVFWKDTNSVYLGCNARFLRDANKQSKSEVIGKTDFDMPWGQAEAESYRAFDRELMSKRKSILNLEETQVQADGSVTQLVTSKVPIVNPHGEVVGILGIYMDITELKNAREALSRQAERAHAYSRMAALGQLASGIAHEINTPLAAISASAELALAHLETIEATDVTITEAFSTIVSTSDKIAQIIKTLKSVTAGDLEDRLSLQTLQTLVVNAADICGDRIRRSNIELKIENDEVKTQVFCRAPELSQALLNVLHHACDSVEQMGERWIRVEVKTEGQLVQLRCTDSSPKVDEAVRQAMFENLYSVKNCESGLSLNLSVTRDIIARHGGRFTYEPHGDHSSFVITLPLPFVETAKKPSAHAVA